MAKRWCSRAAARSTRHLGKSAKPDKNAQAAGMGHRCDRGRAAFAWRYRVRQGGLRESAGFAGREECRLVGEEASLDRADRRQEKGRAARGVARPKRHTALVARRKADRISLESQGPLAHRRARVGDEEDYLSRADDES